MYNKYRPRRFCIICGTEISGTRRIKTCENENCIHEYKLLHYKEALQDKTCKQCGKTFKGTFKQCLCEDCRKASHLHKQYKTIEQTIICQQCGAEIEKRTKCTTSPNTRSIVYATCDDCKKENRLKNSLASSIRMKENNPMFNKEIAKKAGDRTRDIYLQKCKDLGVVPKPRQIKKERKETKEETALRMHMNNPMYDEVVKQKAIATLKQRIANGEVKYKTGKDSPLWKGNRTLNKHIRISLRKWVRMKFETSNFTCQENGENHCELQVHHLLPLRDIVDDFLNKYNTNSQDILQNEELLKSFTEDVVSYHYEHPEIGIVVCPKCHHKLDKQYRRLTYYQKKQ